MPAPGGKAGGKRSAKNNGIGSAVLHHCLRQQAENAEKHQALIRSLKQNDAEKAFDASAAPAGVAFGGSISRHRTLEFLAGNLTTPNPAKGSVQSKHKDQHLRSVLERSGLDEYLSTALAAQDTFAVDRYEARLLQGEITAPSLVSAKGLLEGGSDISHLSNEGGDVQIPRRPVFFTKEAAQASKELKQEERLGDSKAVRSRRRRNKARVKLLLAGKVEEATIHNVQFVRQQRDELHRRFQKAREAKASGRRARPRKSAATRKGEDVGKESYAESASDWDSDASQLGSDVAEQSHNEETENSSGSDSDKVASPSLQSSTPPMESSDSEAEQGASSPPIAQASSAVRLPRTAAELDAIELDGFLQWRRSLAKMEEDGIILTPYERNLEVWRQLWRVVERSHLVLQIVDGRSPAFFRCRDLEKYVKELSPDKRVILVVNKSDLLPAGVRAQWATYFAANGVDAVFFSALRELDQQEKEDEEHFGSESSDVSSGSQLEDDDATQAKEENKMTPSTVQAPHGANGGTVPEILSRDSLIKLLAKHRDEYFASQAYRDTTAESSGSEQFVVGTVGYPNVGKSSLINALLGLKKVSVSHQPGKTRRLQTIPIKGSGLTLCDCPGLVFPKTVTSKHILVLNGVVPVDEMRGDYLSSVEMLCNEIPHTLLRHYGISVEAYRDAQKAYALDRGPAGTPPPRRDHQRLLQGRVEAVCVLSAIAAQRHFVSGGKGGQLDLYRAAKMILRDLTTGRLLRCHLPGGSVFEGEAEAAKAAQFISEVQSSVETRLGEAGQTSPVAEPRATSRGRGAAASPRNPQQINPVKVLQELEEDFDLLEVIEAGEGGQAADRKAPILMTKRKARQMQKQMQKGKGSGLAGFLPRR
ncbi:hypothetical protein Emed_002760 [Eimeria media]